MAAGTVRMAFDGSISGVSFRKIEGGQHRSSVPGLEPASRCHEQRLTALPSWLVVSPALDGKAENEVCDITEFASFVTHELSTSACKV
jgi:hypothetical protein